MQRVKAITAKRQSDHYRPSAKQLDQDVNHLLNVLARYQRAVRHAWASNERACTRTRVSQSLVVKDTALENLMVEPNTPEQNTD